MATLLIEQPKRYPLDKMDVSKALSKGDLLARCSEMSCDADGHEGSGCEREVHNGCHRFRRRVLVILVGLLFLLGMILFAASYTRYDFWECATGAFEGLVKRATEDNSNDLNRTDNVFIHHKFYLIIIFIGLALLLFLVVMLSAWCCRGAFENPLCCPCYLCACCGGLACLECLSCGLCAAAAEV